MEEEIKKVAVELQKGCHKMIDKLIITNPKCDHQDLTNVWMFKKLAEYEIRIKGLEKLHTTIL